MATMKGGIFSQTRGSIGGVTASTWKGINYLKSKPIPTDPKSDGQIFQRQKMATARAILAKAKKCGLWDIIKPAFNDEMPEQDFIRKMVKNFLTKTFRSIVFYGLDNGGNEIYEAEMSFFNSLPDLEGGRLFNKYIEQSEQIKYREFEMPVYESFDEVYLLNGLSAYNPNTQRIIVWQFTPYGEGYNILNIMTPETAAKVYNHIDVTGHDTLNYVPLCFVFTANFSNASDLSTFKSMGAWNFNCTDIFNFYSMKKKTNTVPVVGQKLYWSATSDNPKTIWGTVTYVGEI